MRAPPPIRKNKRNWIPLTFIKIKNKLSMRKCKRRWQLHKLHRTQYRKCKDDKYNKYCKKGRLKGQITTATDVLTDSNLNAESGHSNVKKNIHNNYDLLTGVRVEDTFNLETQYLPGSQVDKPLLVASFRRGCAHSPNVTILQRNKLSRLKLSKRQYSLKSYNLKNSMRVNQISIADGKDFQCSQTVRVIKKLTKENADIKVIFHNDNVVKNNFVQVEPGDNNLIPDVQDQATTEENLILGSNRVEEIADSKSTTTKMKPQKMKRLFKTLLNATQ